MTSAKYPLAIARLHSHRLDASGVIGEQRGDRRPEQQIDAT